MPFDFFFDRINFVENFVCNRNNDKRFTAQQRAIEHGLNSDHTQTHIRRAKRATECRGRQRPNARTELDPISYHIQKPTPNYLKS